MQRAAAGLAAACVSLLARQPGRCYGARVVVLAGSGDNGGDALYAGARLARRGAAVTAVTAAPKTHEGGLADLRAAGGRSTADLGQAAAALAAADLIIDGLLGIGGHGGLREPFAALARQAADAAQAGATVVAVDLPSGIDADTGTVDGPAVRADVTVTFGALKPGLLIDPGAGYAGTVELVDIGLGPYLDGEPAALAAQHGDLRELLPRPSAESDKYRRGVIGLLAGSDRFAGAAVLSAGGAVHGGAGMVRVVTAPVPAAVVRQAWPEAVLTVHPEGRRLGPARPGRPGPGLGGRPRHGYRRCRRRPPGRHPGHRPAGPGRRGRPDHPEPARGPAAPAGAHADHAARRGTGPAAAHRPGPHRGRPARARPPGRRTARRHRAAQGLHHGGGLARPPDRAGQPDRYALAGYRGLGRRAFRPGGRAAGPGPRAAWAGAAAAYLHGLSARLAAAPRAGRRRDREPAPEAPISASDVVRSLPAAFRSLGA